MADRAAWELAPGPGASKNLITNRLFEDTMLDLNDVWVPEAPWVYDPDTQSWVCDGSQIAPTRLSRPLAAHMPSFADFGGRFRLEDVTAGSVGALVEGAGGIPSMEIITPKSVSGFYVEESIAQIGTFEIASYHIEAAADFVGRVSYASAGYPQFFSDYREANP